MVAFGPYALSRELLLAEAFAANRTLESLEFSFGSNSYMVESVHMPLSSHPRLCEPKLLCGWRASVAQIHCLANFLRSTTLLEHLLFSIYAFDKVHMGDIVEGLHSSQSLAKLLLRSCKFDLEAAAVLRSFMEMGGIRSSIRETTNFQSYRYGVCVTASSSSFSTYGRQLF